MIARRYGHIRSNRVPAGAIHHERLVGDVKVPPIVELPDVIYDQGFASSCFGFGFGKSAEAAALLRAAPGEVVEPVSALAAYSLARMYMVGDPFADLVDGGTDPVSGLEALQRCGVMAESDYPYTDLPTPESDPSADGRTLPGLNDRLEIGELEQMAVARLDGFSWINDVGPALCAAIRRCLAAGIYVSFGMDVDPIYENQHPGQVWNGPTPGIAPNGGHAQRFSGYRPGAFKVTGSWGRGEGDQGYFWIADSAIEAGHIFDVAALKWAPVVRRFTP